MLARALYASHIRDITGLVIAPRRLRIPHSVAIEDIAKTPTWLHLNAIVSEGTLLTYVYASSYYKVNSEKARRLEWLAEAPDTYDALIRRLGGVSVAARYARDSTIYQTYKKPKAFKRWDKYRDFLLTTLPQELAEIFRARFSKQQATEAVHRQQVRQIVTNDWENNRPIKRREDKDPLEKWKALL